MVEPPPGWKPHAPDTSYEAELVLFDLYRRMTHARKLEIVGELIAMADALATSDERRHHPDADDEEIRLRVLARRFDRPTMLAVWDPSARGAPIDPSR